MLFILAVHTNVNIPATRKLQERIVFKHIHNYLHENDFIYKYQSGFLPNHSTTFQLIDIYHHICQSFDNNQYACSVWSFAMRRKHSTEFGIKEGLDGGRGREAREAERGSGII